MKGSYSYQTIQEGGIYSEVGMIAEMVVWLYISLAITRVGRGMVTCMGRNSQVWETSEPLGISRVLMFWLVLFEERRTEEQNFWLYLPP